MKKEHTPDLEVIDDAKEEKAPAQPTIDKAVDEISKHDSDELLKAEDAKHEISAAPKRHWYKRLFSNKKFAIPVAVIMVLAILSVVPQTRYPIFGLFLKDNYALTVWDSKTNQPISAASVSLAGRTATTDNHGVAHLKVKVGHHMLTITKKYYANLSSNILVPLRSHSGATNFTVQATGRQVPVTVTNKITGKPINNATVKAVDTEARTDNNGQVTIVLPADKTTVTATVSASGYNDNPATIQVTTQTVKANDFQLTPAGKVYFLSKLSGKIDIVKTNLDGTDRQTVLPGTGNEDDIGTVLLASPDWKYLALLAVRKASSPAELDLIDTSNDQLTNIDQGDATFSPVGWDGEKFVYQVDRTNVEAWQPNQQSLKSFDGVSKKLTTLDSTTASGSSNIDNLHQNFSTTYILNDKEVVYAKNWYASYYDFGQLNTQQATLNSIQPDGTGKKVIKSFGVAAGAQTSYVSVDIQSYEPGGLYVYSAIDNPDQVYKYENGQITTTNDVDKNTIFNKVYNYYLVSPSGTKAFWSESRDGKNTLFVGDQNGDNGKQIASLSDYNVYGWYTDDYLLVFKNSSELYIMPVTGGTPQKITDYHKPSQQYNAYGGR